MRSFSQLNPIKLGLGVLQLPWAIVTTIKLRLLSPSDFQARSQISRALSTIGYGEALFPPRTDRHLVVAQRCELVKLKKTFADFFPPRKLISKKPPFYFSCVKVLWVPYLQRRFHPIFPSPYQTVSLWSLSAAHSQLLLSALPLFSQA